MSDEAAPYYVDMVDQQTIGHQFLLSNFGPAAIPKTGWQIDPFGHSTTMGALFALMGMNSWFFGRIDWQDRDVREADQTLELIMQPSASLGASVDIFTGVIPGYCPINNFDWEQGSSDEPIQDDPALEDYNVQDIVDMFVNEVYQYNQDYRTDNIMLTMGCDFEYQNANTWFKNLDKLIYYTNQDGRVNVFYSTPTIYTLSKYEANTTWTTKTDDFFPYADEPHAVWAGYFTSRPAVKGYVRSSSNYLQACRQLEIQAPSESASSFVLWEAMGLAQHHDAVSGTEKQHVAYDYARHLSEGNAECKTVIDDSLSTLIAGSAQTLEFNNCPFLNQSVCGPTTAGNNLAIVVYSAIGQNRTEYVTIPVQAGKSVSISDASGNAVTVDLLPVPSNASISSAVFPVNIPSAGFSTYFLEYTTADPTPAPKATTNVISNSFFELTFDSTTGRLSNIKNLVSGVSTNLYQTFAWFNASVGYTPSDDTPGQASGAYIFRPNCSENTPVPCDPYEVNGGNVELSITIGQGVQEAYQVFSDWVTQTIRLYADQEFIEVSYTVGPIPFQDGFGKEVVSLWSTDLQVNQTWYTDSNGRDMQQRRFNYRPTWDLQVTDPVAYNFFPVDSSMYMQENGTDGRQFVISTDRAQGGASLHNGELMLMVHRRLLADDGRGVGEPLNETGTTGLGLVTTGIQRISLDTAANSPILHKWNTRALNFQPLLSFTPLTGTPQQWLQSKKPSYSALVQPLPVNLHLLTVQDNPFAGDGSMILRIDHSFQVGEDPVYSQPVTVNLFNLFTSIYLDSCTEMSLTANQPLADVHRLVWQQDGVEPGPRAPFERTAEQIKASSKAFDVTISPMEIRTWSCYYHRA